MVTSEGMSQPMRSQLADVFDEVVDVTVIDSEDQVNLTLLDRPELGITFTKLHCWCLVQYSKCVFLDADTLVMKNSDELFDRSELSAAPDAGWPDCFNSGVFVFSPSKETYQSLLKHAATEGSFDGGDQGLLNTYFSTWATQDITRHLPFLYNMCATATYTYLPAFKRYGRNVKIIHFIGTSKPWHVKFDGHGQPQHQMYEEHTAQFLKDWWSIFHSDVKPGLTKLGQEMVGDQPDFGADVSAAMATQCQIVAGSGDQPGSETVGGATCAGPDQSVSEDRSQWEKGAPDYKGTHSFDNILKKIDSTMSSPNTGK
jgi:glycogenin glucosyltransferase